MIDGALEHGVELLIDDGRIAEIRPHTGMPEPFVVSPAFVNAHSHLEYRGMQGAIDAPDYLSWIREVMRLKAEESPEAVREACRLAAKENRATGVAAIGEHTDRPGSAEALRDTGIEAALFQETITFFEWRDPAPKLAAIRGRASENGAFVSPHAFHTVDAETLREFGRSGAPISIHVAETSDENLWTERGEGRLAEFRRSAELPDVHRARLVALLEEAGLVRRYAQFVHCCDVNVSEIGKLAARGVTVAHCPRSNVRLQCPPAPVREMLDAGVVVGLGMDSAASGGPIDMFAEMREALEVSRSRGRPVTAEETWRMATDQGRLSVPGLKARNWRIEVGSGVPLLGLEIAGAMTTEDLIERGSPECVRWL